MRRQTLAALALVPALALGAAGCGSGDGGGSGGTAKPAADDGKKMREFAACMRENGVDMPDPKDGKVEIRVSGKPDQAGKNGKVEAAQRKCRHLMPNGGKPQKPKPEVLAKMRAYARCMRDNGVAKFPDPQPDGGMMLKAGPGTGIDPESRRFKDAQQACAKLAPDGKGPMMSGKGRD
ncbi:hypothetical protein [Actinomadura decatromicini]|uniref:Uncharacterized protein n=1 Tax=Actinomadura decatromicini TaxID=2604572 RepID=A0A5D3F5E8_9ACTN|nr:hypothetical protein [Actinomadura decatromicini]TYK43383.1 hypothetical protein FXF68_37820 [Actinomadura decatromicini]